VAALLAVTVTIGVLRGGLLSRHSAPPPPAKPVVKPRQRPHKPPHAFYVVRAGDTIAAIAVKIHVPESKLLALNPRVSPTALFIGEKLRVR
jgi:LysM repeat protein